MLTALTLTVRWLLGWVLGARPRQLPRWRRPTGATVSVVIPARNEADSLPRLLDALGEQRSVAFETIVVDDHSTDGTGDLARRPGVVVVAAPDLPDGWIGKPWACWTGAQRAVGDIVVFLDADTRPGPDLLASVVGEVVRTGALVTVQPYHRVETRVERASALFNLIAAMGVGVRNAGRAPRIVGAFGPCLALRRSDYFAFGGHHAVRDALLDDLSIAEVATSAGMAVAAYEGGDLIEFRMYPRGFAQIVEGWSKNIAAGAGKVPLARFGMIIAWLSGLIEAGWWTLAGATTLTDLSLWHMAFYALFAAQLGVLLRSAGSFGWSSALLHPLLVATFVLVFLRSIVLTARGAVTWKGRRVPTRTA